MNKQKELIGHWKSKGYFVINLVRVTPIGLPDLVCLKPNHVVFVESKEKWDRMSPLQKIVARKLIKIGFDFYLNNNKFKPETKKTDLF